MKKGLVLEGGAMRGLYSAGVMDVLMENGIEFDGAVGVSAGACFGCNYKSKQPGRVLRYNTTYCRDPRYGNLRSYIKDGEVFNTEFCYYTIPQQLDIFDNETYKKNPMEFYIVCTDAHTGNTIYHRLDDAGGTEVEWIRASAALPLISKPVVIDGVEMVDGGLTDSIPLKWFQDKGYEKNVVILTRDRSYRKKEGKLSLPFRIALRKYPVVKEKMRARGEMYNSQLDYIKKLEEQGKIIVIAPSEKPKVSRIESDPEKLRELYALGRRDAEEKLEQIKKFLSDDK